MLAACSSGGKGPATPVGDGASDGRDAAAATDANDAGIPDVAEASAEGDASVACVPVCATGAACIDGACLPAPVVLARAPGCGAARLALAGASLYWTERETGSVKRLGLTAGAGGPSLVASGQPKPGPVTTDDKNVYWSNEGDRSIMAAPLGASPAADGGGAPPFLTAAAAVRGLVASEGFLYYSAGPSAFKVAALGGAPVMLASFATCKLSQPVALALDADYVYQTDMLSQFVTRERKDGTQSVTDPCSSGPPADGGAPQIAAPETITHSQGELLLDALYVTGGEVVWTDRDSVNAKSIVDTATTARQVASSAASNVITGFVVSGASVYLGESGDPSGGPTADTVQVASLLTTEAGADTPVAKVIATGQPGATSFAADATHVYWATHAPSATAGAADDCAIVSVAK